MLVLTDDHIKRLEEIFDKFRKFEDNYNRDSNHYPSTIWRDIVDFKHDVNQYNLNKDKYLLLLK